MSNATYTQINHWRQMPRNADTVVAFVSQWVDECGVWPSSHDVARVMKMNRQGVCSLMREARAVMEAIR